MGYQNNGHVTDDVMWPSKVLWSSTVGYPSDSLASCLISLWRGSCYTRCSTNGKPSANYRPGR